MTKRKHTPEPWARGVYRDNPEQHSLSVFAENPHGEGQELVCTVRCQVGDYGHEPDANAERIVACVNALAGLEPSAVAGLVAALERIEAETCDHGPGPFCPRDLARSALAAARGAPDA